MDYKEMAEIVKRRGDQIIAEKKARSIRIKKITAAAAGACTAAAAAFALWNGGVLRNVSSKDFEEPSNIIASEDTSAANKNTASANDEQTTRTTTTAAEAPEADTTTSAAESSVTITSTAGAKSSSGAAVTTKIYPTYPPPTVTTAAPASHSNLTVTTAVYAPDSVPAVTTATTPPTYSNDGYTYEPITLEEGKNMIKKYLAALAAASTMTNTAPVSTSPIVRFKQDEVYSSSNMEYYDKFDSGELNADLNGDGTFNVYDVFAVFVCRDKKNSEIIDDKGQPAKFFTREQRMNIIGRENFDEDGELISPDAVPYSYDFSLVLNNYYFYKYGIVLSDYDVNNYLTLDGKFEPESWYTPLNLTYSSSSSSMRFEFGERYDAENNVDFDFNADGTVDIKDCIDYCVFSEYLFGYDVIYYTHTSEFDQYGNAYYGNPGWMQQHYLDALAGIESADGISVPLEYYVQQVPLDDTTIKNCAEYALAHPYYTFTTSAPFMVKHFINNYEFSEEWLDPQFCYDYLHNRVVALGFTDDFTTKMVEDMSGIKGYGYRYLGEARVLAIEAGLVSYNDYGNILSWHSDNPNHLKYGYSMYEHAIANGEIDAPDMDRDGDLDEMDLTILGILYHYENSYRPITDNFAISIENRFRNQDFFTWEPDIEYLSKHFDCNNNGLSCDSADTLFAGMYVAKHGTFDFNNDNYNINFTSYATDILRVLPDELFGDDTTPEPAPAPVPTERTGDASDDGILKMNDAVLIMQSLSNPDKYQLNSRGEFNADIHNTGDGITPMDALKVQRTLLLDN